MLIYEYPPKLSRTERQAKALHDLEEHKKMRRNMYKNFILAAVIAVLAFSSKLVILKIVLAVIAFLNAAVGALVYSFYALSRDEKVYTRIYNDHIEHSQRKLMGREYLHIKLYYSEVEKSFQTPKGRLVCKLGKLKNSSFYKTDKMGNESPYSPEDEISLSFSDTKAKLVLVNELYEKINYPHKEYNDLSDDDDFYSEEDLKWDNLHKHGL